MGNRTSTVINGVTTAYTTNNLNEYTSVGGVQYTYDADGNLIFDGTNTYTYNSLNQLVSVRGPSGTTTYTYNALGQRVASTTNGQTTQYLIDPSGLGNVVGEYTGSGSADRGLHLRTWVDEPGDGERNLLLRFRRARLHGWAEQRGRQRRQQLQLLPVRRESLIDPGDCESVSVRWSDRA